jgi:carbonic anhydrase
MPVRLAKSFPILLAVVCSAWPALGQQHAESGHSWTYDGEHGPTHWADLNPDYAQCKTGTHQSPIDIPKAKPADLPAIESSYARSPFRIVNNGHSVQINLDPGSFVTVAGKRYDLLQFHFHHPSEERVAGKIYPMVAHLVHKDANGKLAVVAVLLKSGRQNPFFEALWKDMPNDVATEHAWDGSDVDLRQLLPRERGYYTFAGSLTTPPCSEDVTWFVLKQAVEMSKAEQAMFAAKYAHNARPIQPLNGRVVQESR